MQNNNKILTENEPKNSKARIKANGKYLKNNYKRINIAVRPEQADRIKETAKRFDLSLAQLIVDSVQLYNDTMCNCTSTGTDTAQQEQPEQPENVTTESPIESGKTAGAQPEEETEEEEQEDEKPEEIPSFVWEQIQRLKKADKRHTAERKAREAAERKRRRMGEIED